MDALTRDQIRRFDRIAIERLGVPGVVLMENAGRNAADTIQQFLDGAVASKKIAIVAGAGNNGGDGYVIARHLAIRGAMVTTFLVCPPEKISGDAAVNLEILRRCGCDVRQVAPDSLKNLGKVLADFDLVVDAVGGTGISGVLRGDIAAAVEAINESGRPVVAVDIPTGLDCDSGKVSGPAVKASLTVTFVAWKKGFDTPGAEKYTGKVVVADIGIPPEIANDECRIPN